MLEIHLQQDILCILDTFSKETLCVTAIRHLTYADSLCFVIEVFQGRGPLLGPYTIILMEGFMKATKQVVLVPAFRPPLNCIKDTPNAFAIKFKRNRLYSSLLLRLMST